MTYDQALARAEAEGASRCDDQALMAALLDGSAQLLLGAVSPKLIWEGAQKRGLTTRELARMIHDDPMAAAELQWEA